MAVAKVHQREIVEVPFTLPDGQILPHPALVISCDELQNIEPGLFYAVLISTKNHYPELTIPIQKEWEDGFGCMNAEEPMGMVSYTEIISRIGEAEQEIERGETYDWDDVLSEARQRVKTTGLYTT